MGMGVSILLIAVGAILTWAIHYGHSGVNLHLIGVILLIVGIAGALLSLVFWSSVGGYGFRREERVPDLGLLKAQHVGGMGPEELADQLGAQADRVDVPSGEFDGSHGFLLFP